MIAREQRESGTTYGASELMIAHVYGDVPPDFAAIAACGFTVVCLDSTAQWYREELLARAKGEGLTPFAFPMRPVG